MTTIPVSVRFDLFKKRLKIRPEPASKEEKDKFSREAGSKATWGWKTEQLSMEGLARHVSSGLAISVSIYADGHRHSSKRVAGHLLGLDFEVNDEALARGVDPSLGVSVEKLEVDEFILPYLGVALPSSSDSPEHPRTRALIPFDRSVTPEEYRRISAVFKEKYGDYLAAGESKDSVRFYFGSTPELGRVYYNEEAILRVDDFLAQHPVPISAQIDERLNTAASYGLTAEGEERVGRHKQRPIEEQEKLVMEMLHYALQGREHPWTRMEWLQLTMAAWDGSDGSRTVRDYIALHPKAPAKLDYQQFRDGWDTHVPRPSSENPVTVASLMFLARQAGWLSNTGLEIPDTITKKINTRYVQKWLESQNTVPSRLLLMSQTGSGKTFMLRYLYERLNAPKTVVFVPSIKLAMELANTLKTVHGLPATLYINPKSGKTLPADQLSSAKILVTTLQTFATKVLTPMSEYGLVYIEESDQLFQQFARGGGGISASHVSEKEAKAGFAKLRDAFEHSHTVWAVDATMTQVSYHMADAMKGKHPLHVIKNEWVEPKPAVLMLKEQNEAVQIVLAGLEARKKVVVVTDTATAAAEVQATMERLGVLKNKRSIVITGETERNPHVHEFMSDVNTYAPKYDLVCYNSVMASGVSITSFAPDIIVQIASYLTPRVNLQLLNRYRKQKVVYCYYQAGENLYAENEKTILGEAQRRAELEAALVSIPLAARTDDANLRSQIAALSVADEAAQRRSAKTFYTALLQGDGRRVEDSSNTPVADVVKHTLKGVRKARKEHEQMLAQTWPTVPPIDRDRPAPDNYDDLQVAQGEIHAEIEKALLGNIPEDLEPEYIYETVKAFRSADYALSAFVQQQVALAKAEKMLLDRDKAVMSMSNQITLIRVVNFLNLMYRDMHDQITEEVLPERAKAFMRQLEFERASYDAVIQRQGQKFAEVYARSDNDIDRAVDFSKIILAKIGLRQRMERNTKKEKVYIISNAQAAEEYLSWRYFDTDAVIDFSSNGIGDVIENRADHDALFRQMTAEEREAVSTMMVQNHRTSLQQAISSVWAKRNLDF